MSDRRKQRVKIGGRELAFSNLDKVLWPKDGYTKGDLIAYYARVAKWLVPYLKDRPLTLQRYPDGINGPSFFEKNAPRGLPAWVKTLAVRASDSRRGTVRYILCNDAPTLAYVANLAAITLHAWISQRGSLDSPDLLLFDLDPWTGCKLATLACVALAVRGVLETYGLRPAVKSSGGSGLHVMLRLKSGYRYDQVRDFAETVARRVESQHPDMVTLQRMTARRKRGTVYIDYLQIGKGKTIVPPFVARARPGAPVSFPLAWSDVERMTRKHDVNADKEFARFTIANVPAVLARKGDPWRSVMRAAQPFKPATETKKSLSGRAPQSKNGRGGSPMPRRITRTLGAT